MAGVNGAIPGLIMEADPRIPDAYRQEFLAGEAEDTAWVVKRGGLGPRAVRHDPPQAVDARSHPRRARRSMTSRSTGPGLGIVVERALSGPPEVAKLVRVIDP